MDRLPREAREFLALAADGHDPPDPGARTRMQARLAALALLPKPDGAPLPPAPALPKMAGSTPTSGWLASPKLVVAGVVALTLSGGLWALSTQPSESAPPANVSPVQAPSSASASLGQVEVSQLAPREVALDPLREVEVAQLPAHDESGATTSLEAAATPARPHSFSRQARQERPTASDASSLAHETALLRRASEKLGQHEIGAALALLEEHRRSYRASQLAEERNGLFALAQCLGERRDAKRQAQTFVAHAPSSLLVPRLVSACGL